MSKKTKAFMKTGVIGILTTNPENKNQKTSGLAIASLVLGIFAVLLGWIPVFGWAFIILTLTFGIIALNRINKGLQSGRGFGIAGVILGVVGLFLACLLMFFTFNRGVTVYDSDSFLNKADICSQATYKETNDFGTIRYSITSEGDKCIFSKEIVELSKNEDPVIEKILQGKKMVCEYAPGNFNSLLVSSILFGAEDCDGELKEAIGHLLLLV